MSLVSYVMQVHVYTFMSVGTGSEYAIRAMYRATYAITAVRGVEGTPGVVAWRHTRTHTHTHTHTHACTKREQHVPTEIDLSAITLFVGVQLGFCVRGARARRVCVCVCVCACVFMCVCVCVCVRARAYLGHADATES